MTRNPHLILLAEIRYRDAAPGFLPEEAPWWKRDEKNQFIMGRAEGGHRLLDVANPDWQAQVAKRAKAVMETRVFDGIMLDWWNDDESRQSLIRRIRQAIGHNALVLVNANDLPIPRTARSADSARLPAHRWSVGANLRERQSHLQPCWQFHDQSLFRIPPPKQSLRAHRHRA